MRINKYLAQHGIASRRKSEELISSGKVKVNGVVIRDLSFQINEVQDDVMVNNQALKQFEEKVYYLLNKPKDVISAASSRHKEITVVDLIKNEKARIFPVGRLDKDTEGMMILTNDGDLAYHLTHPKFEKTKTYEALLKGKVHHTDLQKLAKGIEIDGYRTSKANIRLLKMINQNSLVQFTIHEGRNRQIRKMAEFIGHPVIELKRTSEAGIDLGNLKVGEYRKLTEQEVLKLKQYNNKTGRRK